MKISGVITQDDFESDLGKVADLAYADALVSHPGLEEALVGDLIFLLGAPQPQMEWPEDLPFYKEMIFEIWQGSRWQRLRRRLATRQHSEALQKSRMDALHFLVASIAGRLAEFLPADAATEGYAQLEKIGEQYIEATKFARDKSEFLANDHMLIMAEFARRGYDLNFVTDVYAMDLLDLCVEDRWEEDEYDARQLEIVHLPGDEEERLPGELYGVRGVTIKTREDQIREILPSELAPWFRDDVGKRVTLDKIVNRNPLIFEHFTTTRPLSRHRVLVALIAAAPRRHSQVAELGAEARARLAVFHLLFALARRVPRDQVQVDVALFTRTEAHWDGASFPLEIVPARDQAWRNILELDELQPKFFAHFETLHTRPKEHERRRRNMESFQSAPGPWIERAMTREAYRGVLIAAFGRAVDRSSSLPPASLPLPRMEAQTPLVLLGLGEDESVPFSSEPFDESKPEEHNALRREAFYRLATQLQGRAFPDLLSAHLAPLPLPQTTLPDLAAQFLEMVIGPRRDPVAQLAS